jgi:L-malate glycosyltransferase
MNGMKRKNVLFLSSWYPTRLSPTNGDFVQRHADAASKFHNVVVLHVVYDNNLEKNCEWTINSRNDLTEYIVYFKLPRIFRFLKSAAYIYTYAAGVRKIEKAHGRIDLIHANVLHPIGLVTLVLKFLYRIPYVFTEHWTGFLPMNRVKLSSLNMYFVRLAAKRAKCVMVVSENLRNSMQNLSIKANYAILNNVVDTSIFKVGEKKNTSTYRFLHVSTLNEAHKNVKGILRTMLALSKIREDFVLDIVSENSGNEILAYSRELSIEKHIQFHGYKNRTELAEMMQNSSFLILFSNYENFPCVIVEAFAAGLPVISSNVGGIAEHVSTDKGLLVAAGDEKMLLDAILDGLKNIERFDAVKLSEYANNNFGYEAVGTELTKIYNLS